MSTFTEFTDKFLASFQKLIEYNIINKIQTGDRAYDSLLSGLLILLISYILRKELMEYISLHYRRFIPRKISNMITKTEKERYIKDTNFIIISKECAEIYKARYYRKELYQIMYWDNELSPEFEKALIEYLFDNYSYLMTRTRYILKKDEVRLPLSRKYISEFREGAKEKLIPIFYHNQELILLNYTNDGGFDIHYKSLVTLKIFNDLVHQYNTPKNVIEVKDSSVKVSVYDLAVNDGNNLNFVPKGSIYSDRTFDTFVSKHKRTIMSLLDNFTGINKGTVKKFGGFGSYNLGFLLYGKPGCGKTMLIKAIANYLRRDVINVDMRLIRTKTMFEKLFTTGAGISGNIYVFEEFDCVQGIISRDVDMTTTTVSPQAASFDTTKFSSNEGTRGGGWSSYRNQYTAKSFFEEPDEKSDLKRERMNLVALLTKATDEKVRTSIQDNIKDIDKKLQLLGDGLTLDTMLTVLDGVHERRDRIIIATTNYPDRIDSALLREGRFDKKLNLTEFDAEETRELLHLMYTDDPDKDSIQHTRFFDGFLTPIQIMNTCFSSNSLSDALKCLSNESYVKNLRQSALKKVESTPIIILSEDEKQQRLKEFTLKAHAEEVKVAEKIAEKIAEKVEEKKTVKSSEPQWIFTNYKPGSMANDIPATASTCASMSSHIPVFTTDGTLQIISKNRE